MENKIDTKNYRYLLTKKVDKVSKIIPARV